MRTGILLSAAWDDGRTQSDMPWGARQGRCSCGSSRRAASFQDTNALHYLQLQVQRESEQNGTLRQCFDRLCNLTQRELREADQAPGIGGLTDNNNDYGTDEMHKHEFSMRTEDLRQSKWDALTQRYNKSHVPWVGFMPQPWLHGVFCWMYCQVNGLAGNRSKRNKVRDIRQLAEKYDVDGIALVEVGVNWKYFGTSARLSSWFESVASCELRATAAFNTHMPVVSAKQQGGTAIVLCHGLLQYA